MNFVSTNHSPIIATEQIDAAKNILDNSPGFVGTGGFDALVGFDSSIEFDFDGYDHVNILNTTNFSDYD